MSEIQKSPLTSFASLVTDRVTIQKKLLMPYVGLEHIRSKDFAFSELGLAGDSISTNGVFRAGDTLFGKLRPRLRKSARANFEGYCSTDILVLRPNEPADAAFVSFVLRSDAIFSEAIRTEEGTKMPRCSWHSIKHLEVFYPQAAERRRIAEILSILDETIEQTEALIAKYQQIKVGLMQDLFTRGVTPDGRLRPTRAQAPHLYLESPLGWIPKDWPLVNLGTFAEIVSGVTLGVKSEPRAGITVPYLRVANVQDGYFDLGDIKTIKVDHSQFEKLRLKAGDVLMNEGGDFDKLGRGSVWYEEIDPCIHQNHVFRVRPRNGRLQSEFLAYWSQSEFGKRYFVLSSKQSTNLASINSSQLNRFPVVLPSNQEQTAIEVRVAAVSHRIASLRDEANKLRLIKDGLMHDLLTGRVRVKATQSEEVLA